MASETRHRILEAAASSLAARGYRGTGLKQLATGSGAPIGSLYHFFPGGKEDIAGAALVQSAAAFSARVGAVLVEQQDSPADAVRHAFRRVAETLESSDYADACPIATVALEVASSHEPLRRVTGEIFETWLRELDAWFASAGIPSSECRALSTLFLAGLEGGFLLCRAARETTPMRQLGEHIASAVEATLATKRRRRNRRGDLATADTG